MDFWGMFYGFWTSMLLPCIKKVQTHTGFDWFGFLQHIQFKFLNHLLPEVTRLYPSRAHWPFQLSELRELWWIDSSMDKHNMILCFPSWIMFFLGETLHSCECLSIHKKNLKSQFTNFSWLISSVFLLLFYD